MAERSVHAGSQAELNPIRVRFDAFDLDEANASLLRKGTPVALPPTPFAVLCALVRKRGSLLSTNALLDEVWGHQFVSDSVLRTAISELRTALEDDARQPRFIQTVSRRGYRFIADASDMTASPAGSTNDSTNASIEGTCFIGRGEARSRLRRAWDRACSGKRAVVWVAGEPGIGKTTLIERFVASLGDVACARGQCVEHYGTGEPYLPVLEALASLCRADASVAAMLRAVAPAWLLQLPWLSTPEERDAVRRELAGVGPDRMLREMGEFLDRYTERRPLLLVTEDLHWSDRSTVQLIDFIARRRGGARLMWLASFRLAEVVALDHPLNPLRHELRLHELCEEIVLDPFSEAEVADFVAQRSKSMAGDEAFVRSLHGRTDGVPLFVASVVTDVMTQAAQSDGEPDPAELANLSVPENLTGIIDHYIAKLASEDREILAAAAVCGIEFRVAIVSAALDRDPAGVGQSCEDLARRHLWLAAPRSEASEPAVEPPYAFRHALFRQVLYERTALPVRVQLHRKVGAALERERASGVAVPAAELAMHFDRGREPGTAARYYAEAADAALMRLSPAECLAISERALSLLEVVPETAERDTLEITLATLRGLSATHVAGFGAEAQNAFSRAFSLLDRVPDHPMRKRLLHGFGLVLSLRADYTAALAVAERAEALSSATNDPALMVAACIVHGEAYQLQGRSRVALAWLERGLAAVDPPDAGTPEIFVVDPQVTLLGLLALQLLSLGLVRQGRARLELANTRARLLGQPMTRLAAHWYDALFEVRLQNPQRVAALADDMQALVDEFAVTQGRIAGGWFRGWAQARLGEPAEGYRRIREAYEENARLGMLAGASEVHGYAAEALLLSGDLNAAKVELDEAMHLASTLGERVYLSQLFLLEAAIARARRDPDTARASVRSAIAEARAQEAPWLELMALLDLFEYGGETADDRRSLAALVDQLSEADDTVAVAKARDLLGGRAHPPASTRAPGP